MATVVSAQQRGTAAIIAACVLFAGIYYITPRLAPLGGIEVWASRIIVAIPIVALILVIMRQTRLFVDVWRLMRATPRVIPGVILTGGLLSVQLWIFGWAPLNDSALQVALGYFLLPLVLVLVGRVLYRDRLKWWHWFAAVVAAIGVGFEVINAGGVSWETLVVCLGYPVYFVTRRALGIANTGGMLWEFIVVSPIAVWILARELTSGDAFSQNPSLWWFVPLFGLLAAIALWLYVLASRMLPISIFGLLSYLEPALLVVASLLIGERIAGREFVLYGAIWFAVTILLAGGVIDALRNRRRPGPSIIAPVA